MDEKHELKPSFDMYARHVDDVVSYIRTMKKLGASENIGEGLYLYITHLSASTILSFMGDQNDSAIDDVLRAYVNAVKTLMLDREDAAERIPIDISAMNS
jgi:hypothetical protein